MHQSRAVSSLASITAGSCPFLPLQHKHFKYRVISRDAGKHISSEQVGHKPFTIQASYLPLCPRRWVAPGPALPKFGSIQGKWGHVFYHLDVQMDIQQQLFTSIEITHSLKPLLLLKHEVLAAAYPGCEVMMLLQTFRG